MSDSNVLWRVHQPRNTGSHSFFGAMRDNAVNAAAYFIISSKCLRVVGRQCDELGRRCHMAEPPRIVEGGVHVGIDQFDRLGAIVLRWRCGYRELPLEPVAAGG